MPIHQEVTFNASPERVYAALVESAQFSKLSGGAPAAISKEAGGTVSCFGGMIEGRQIELVPNKRIVQAWRAKNWGEGQYSIARFELKPSGKDQTTLVFDHDGFPEGQQEHLAAGWHANYWEPLKK